MSTSSPKDEPVNEESDVNGSIQKLPTRQSQLRPADTISQHGRTQEPEPEASKSLLQRAKSIWAKTGIDKRTYMSMFKGALAPTIAMALFQSDSFSSFYTTLGYLVIIMTILPVVVMPRAKFLQTMVTSTSL